MVAVLKPHSFMVVDWNGEEPFLILPQGSPVLATFTSSSLLNSFRCCFISDTAFVTEPKENLAISCCILSMERIMSLNIFSHSCSALWAEFYRGRQAGAGSFPCASEWASCCKSPCTLDRGTSRCGPHGPSRSLGRWSRKCVRMG
ncbi:hypothetical protein XENOCAPTIV_017991 [Xenoophorus captivus]|uniref:Uncharacterized protein n=1 Tax=Xenoophorus captivus TaxID=1517983 RepID=A0ABV0RCS8_9TELE